MGPGAWDQIAAALRAHSASRLSDGVAHHAAVALALRDGADGIELLFIRRAEDPKDPWSGQMAFPGGRREPSDASLLDTAIRETREETGLDLAGQAEWLGALDEIQAMARMQALGLAIAPFVFRLNAIAEARPSAEVRSVHWIPLAALADRGNRSTYDYDHDGTPYPLPCLRVDDLIIWGLTHRMLSGFLDLVARTEAPHPHLRQTLRRP
jgi:8-oxo-dGTP pyrophosphatase MutT (NUDIX family)